MTCHSRVCELLHLRCIARCHGMTCKSHSSGRICAFKVFFSCPGLTSCSISFRAGVGLQICQGGFRSSLAPWRPKTEQQTSIRHKDAGKALLLKIDLEVGLHAAHVSKLDLDSDALCNICHFRTLRYPHACCHGCSSGCQPQLVIFALGAAEA